MVELIDLIVQNPPQAKRIDDPSMIVMHYTSAEFSSVNNFFLKNQTTNEIIAHYVIDSDVNGAIYQYLRNDYIGKQAGISYWNGKSNVNQYSVGIENVNYGFSDIDRGDGVLMNDNLFYYSFSDAQIDSLINLTSELINLYDIKPYNIVGHSDIAISAGRKDDPGPLFPWEKLAKEYGIGLWYNLSLTQNEFQDISKIISNFSDEEKLFFFINKLMEFGYGSPEFVPNPTIDNQYQIKNTNEVGIINDNTKYLIKNYNMHYRPDKGLSSSIDAKDFEIINSLNIIKNITQNNTLPLDQLRDLYGTNDQNHDYLELHHIRYYKIDDTVNFFK